MFSLRSILDTRLFQIGDTHVTVATSLTGLLVVVGAYLISRGSQAAIRRTLDRKGVEQGSGVRIATRILHWLIMAIGGAIALQTAGIELGALFAASAVFAVGFGFAMQTIAQNFVSGVILLLERTIRPGHVLEVDGRIVRVRDMGVRATIVRTRDEEDLIVPNALLVQQIVKNLTLDDHAFRVRVTVGVHYRSDLDLVVEALEAAGRAVPFRLEGREPTVLLKEFGASTVDFEVAVDSADPWEAKQHQSRLRHEIWRAFRARGVEIAFPQLDVHLDPPVVEALRRAA